MGKQFGKNRGLKRAKAPLKSESKHVIKNRRVEEKLARTRTRTRSPSPSSSGEPLEEQSSGVASDEEVIHREASMYDNLLMTLRSCSKTVDDAYKKRQRQEEGKSDSEEDEDDGSESFSVSVKDDNEDESTLQEPDLVDAGEQSEDIETEDDHEASDTDQEHDVRVNGQNLAEGSACLSSFSIHLGHELSEEEVENLSTKKWLYKWEVPVAGMSNCKWMGTGECFLKDVNINSGYDLKPKLHKHWLDVYKTSGGNDFHSSKERLFFSLCNSYRDILHCNKKPFYLKGLEEDSSIMDAYIVHSLNHVFRTRDLVTKNDAKLAKHPEIADNDSLAVNFLDHGYTRPKVLILLPLKCIALRVVQRLIQLTPSAYKVNVDHIDRFLKEFGNQEDEDSEDELSQHTHGNSKAKKSSKPSDFLELFGGKRDEEDQFMFGIKFTRRSIKLYSDFYSSDVIVASPVRLIAKIWEAKRFQEKDVDYLSSIEVLIIDHADVIAMQNWSHVNTVVEQLNHRPSKQDRTDITRIRKLYSDEYARLYRQTIILGSYSNPDINALFNRHCINYQGKVKLVCEYKGVLPKVILQVRQIYERFDVDSIADADDARFDYFVKKVFPKIKDSVQGGIMLFISSYFEYVRIRNFLKSQDASFCLLGEYTQQSDISRARVWFFEGRRKIMLYTERAHFYYRYKIRGIQNLIVYSLPERKEFYPEIVNMLDGSHNLSCTVLFSRFDQFRLERIVGTAPAKRMATSEKGVFVFC